MDKGTTMNSKDFTLTTVAISVTIIGGTTIFTLDELLTLFPRLKYFAYFFIVMFTLLAIETCLKNCSYWCIKHDIVQTGANLELLASLYGIRREYYGNHWRQPRHECTYYTESDCEEFNMSLEGWYESDRHLTERIKEAQAAQAPTITKNFR
jgi:hypothetical protein